MIPDPNNPNVAIDPKTGKLAASLRIIPTGAIKDIHAPTVEELRAAKHIGWVTENSPHDDD